MYITNLEEKKKRYANIITNKNNEPNDIAVCFFSGHTHRYLLKSFDIQQWCKLISLLIGS